MSITTKTTYDLIGMTFGCSDTCDTLFSNGNLTVNELARFSWCRWNDRYTNCMAATPINIADWQGAAVCALSSYFQNNGGDLKTKYVDDRITNATPYAFNILMYSNNGLHDVNITSENASNYRVVTSCSDFQNICFSVDRYTQNEGTRTIQHPTTKTIDINRLLWNNDGALYNLSTNNSSTKINVWTVIVIDSSTFFITRGMAFPNCNPCIYDGVFGSAQQNIRPSNIIDLDNNPVDDRWRYADSVIKTYDGTKCLMTWYKNGIAVIEDTTWTAQQQFGCWDVDNDVVIIMSGSWGTYNYTYALKTENAVKNAIAYSGLRWKYTHGDTEHIYTPIINGDGYITGYSTDPNAETKLNDVIDVTGNNINPLPPSPIGGDNENEEINMPLAYIGGTGGFVQFIKINSAGLASADDISAALSRFDITTIGKDLLRNFVSYKCFAVLNIDPDDTVTRQITVDGHGLTDENDQPLNGQVIGSVLPIDFTIGTPTRYFNDFRDFAPYTKIEAYVPFCGWFTLPSWCIGHKITGTMFTDLYNGTVKAVIFAGQTVVAEVGGCCAYDIPFVADATGAKAGAVISSALSTAAATAATVSIPNVATGISAVTSAANTICAINSNDTTLKGVLGDGSNLNGLLHCYLKVTRPQSPTRSNGIPDTYKHEIGIPTCKELTLTSGDGYTQIMDANIEGDMTDREKQMIIDGFRHGLIL